MKGSAAAIAFAAIIFLSCASVSQSDAIPVPEVPADFAGIVHAGRTGTQQEMDYLNYLGVRWTLLTFTWDIIEREKGNWDFTYHDEIVNRTQEAGIKIIGVLAYDSRHIHDGERRRNYIPREKFSDYAEYVRMTAEHFRGRIGAWCIWNEPNTSHFWKGTDEEFFELARLAAETVREIDSEVILLGGAVNREISGLPKKFIKGLFEYGAMEKVDAIALHPYELNPARAAHLYDKFKKICAPYGFENKIWVSEMGFPTGGKYPTRIPEKKLSAYVIKTFTLMAAREAGRLLWYQLFDPAERRAGNSEDYFGLVRNSEDYASKGAEAFRLCAAYVSGTQFNTQELMRENLPASLETFYFRGSENSALVIWNNSPVPVKIQAILPGAGHAMHNITSGRADAVHANTEIRAGGEPVFITWQGGSLQPVFLKKK